MAAFTEKKTVDHTDVSGLKKLFIGRRIVAVEGDSLLLDNDVTLKIVPLDACCAYYEIDFIAEYDNVIAGISVTETAGDPLSGAYTNNLCVYAPGVGKKRGKKHELVSVSGHDGSGNYGTGFHIAVEYDTDAF